MWYHNNMNILEIQPKIAPILRRYGIKKASVFGSTSRGEERADSDVDILIELGRPMGMIAYSRLTRELEEVLGSKVDLVTEKSLNKSIAGTVHEEAQPIYEE